MVFQEILKGISSSLRWFQGSMVFQGSLRNFKEVSRIFQEKFEGVSREIEGYFK